jgi:energy-coupling factor transporter ATP-binding protein EcfA2
MSISADEIARTFTPLGRCEPTESGLLRCLRKDSSDQNPLAVYWLDNRESIPITDAELAAYQADLFGRDFYELPKELQYNQYLLFLVSDEAKAKAKFAEIQQRIESDVSYARKFVVTPSELTEFVKNVKDAFGPPSRLTSPTERWTDALDKVGLAGIYEDRARAEVIRDIENGKIGPEAITAGTLGPTRSKKREFRSEPEKLPFLRRVHLKNFGQHPPDPSIDLGRVTLVYGENGTGKTTILEAIEFAFCGANLRGPRKVEQGAPEAEVEFEGNPVPTRFGRTSKDRLAKDLNWFGAYARRDAHLEYSFNRYVFFNSDTSYQLQYSESQQTIAASISRLALGESANLLWGLLEEYEIELAKVKGSRASDHRAALERQKVAAKLAKDLAAPTLTSEEAFERAKKAMQALKFRNVPGLAKEFTPATLEALGRAADSLSKLAGSVAWIPDANIASVDERERSIGGQIKEVAENIERYAKHTSELDDKRARLAKRETDVASLHRFQIYIRNSWPRLFRELRSLEKSERATSELSELASQLQVTVRVLLDDSKTVQAALSDRRARRTQLFAEVEASRRAIEELQKAISEREALLGHIRALARTYVQSDLHVLSCPVCSSIFKHGELSARLDLSLSRASEDETKVISMRQVLQEKETAHKDVQVVEGALQVLQEIAALIDAPPDATIGDVIRAYETRLTQQQQDALRLKGLRGTLQSLALQGLSDTEYRSLEKQVGALLKISEIGHEAEERRVDAEIKKANKELDVLTKRKAELESEIARLSRALDQVRSAYQAGDIPVSDLLSYVRQIHKRATEAQALFTQVSRDVRLSREDSFQQYLLLASVARDRSREFLGAQEQEARRQAELAKLKTNAEEARKAEGVAKVRLSRVEQAFNAVVDIRREHSLERVIGGFLDTHRTRINAIFGAIHSPQEFAEILVSPSGNSGVQLRRMDGQVVDVTQISTGQRSALALSLFFTLNEKLAGGPSVILLDDPVVNIDDLNVLGFFDYLREVALTGRRQIVYVTANDRMASLFESKFAFMREGFKKKPLTRGGDQ